MYSFELNKKFNKNKFALSVAATALCLSATPSFALNILVCNDDSIAAANARALKVKLAAAGHSVIMSGPIAQQSGQGGATTFLRPIPALLGTERAASPTTGFGIAAGSPGIGTDPSDADVSYVNGTPIMACVYGLDVKAPAKWGKGPDLVISGPNEGNNSGPIVVSSGTVNNIFYAIDRGIPAIAVSDNALAQVKWNPSLLPATAQAYEVADIVVRLVKGLEKSKKGPNGRLMPKLVGLNVNIPKFAPGAGPSLGFKLTEVGYESEYALGFYNDMGSSRLAADFGVAAALSGVSGISGGRSGDIVNGITVLPGDTSPDAEQNVLRAGGFVTISPVEGAPRVRESLEEKVRENLRGLIKPDSGGHHNGYSVSPFGSLFSQ